MLQLTNGYLGLNLLLHLSPDPILGWPILGTWPTYSSGRGWGGPLDRATARTKSLATRRSETGRVAPLPTFKQYGPPKKKVTLYLNEKFIITFPDYSFLQVLNAERQTETEKMKRAMAAFLLVLLSLLVHSNAEEEAFDVRHHLSTVSRFLSHKIKISH